MSGAAATRWGIAGAGNISNDFVRALKLLPAAEHKVAAIAARSLQRAQEFAKKYDIPKAYGSYEEMAQDKDIDVVYVGTTNVTHLDVSTLMLNHNKPTLCEKPITVNLKQTKQLTAVARSKQVLLVEGYWSRHFPAWKQIEAELKAGSLGDVRMVSIDFGFDILQFGDGLKDRSLAGGALLAVGCYNLLLLNTIFKEKPQKVVASGLLTDTGVDETACVTLHYSGRRMAHINFSIGTLLSNTCVISGSKDNMQVPFFWTPSSLTTSAGTQTFELPAHTTQFNLPRSEGFVYEAEALRQSLLVGDKENPAVPLQDSEDIMEIMDEIRRQLGVVFDQDS